MKDGSTRAARQKRRRQAAATREQLLAAARETFETRGYQATTVAAITSAANTAHGTFYLYFKNKEDAFARVVEDVTEELYRESDRGAPGRPYESIEAATRGFLQVFVDHRGLWRALLEAILQSEALERMWLDIRRRFVERNMRSVERLLAQGTNEPLDAELTAHALGSMAEWFAFTHFVLHEPPVTAASFEAAVRTLTELWFRAIYARPPDDVRDRLPDDVTVGGSSSGASAPI